MSSNLGVLKSQLNNSWVKIAPSNRQVLGHTGLPLILVQVREEGDLALSWSSRRHLLADQSLGKLLLRLFVISFDLIRHPDFSVLF